MAIRLQFEFAARRSEICPLEWSWLDFRENRRVVWPDSKVGGISKPMSEEAYRLLSTAPRLEGCPYVLPSPNDPAKHLTFGEHYGGVCRTLKAASVPHVGTHGIRHRSTTDIANSGVPTKVGMKLTGHKTVAMFMHYVHTEDKPCARRPSWWPAAAKPSRARGSLRRRWHERAPAISSIARSARGAAGRHSGA
ncbi:tyrosine-type recombinase/integrase [Enterobacter cloacae complex sp. 288G10]|uniref:tyrosine-type recombinase/integrase n=1 Tax=Enterobacter cloacae complex sp. 288G10 TaxID=3395859 RepID=UPI003CEAA0E5